MPIQRVLRYRMLLEEMVKDLRKKGNDGHPDVALLDEALGKIKGAATAINDVIKVRENQQELLELESKWNGYEFSKAGRTIIKHGPLVKRCRRADKPFYFVLFSDVLVYGRKETLGTVDRYVHHREIQLEHSKVLSISDESEKPVEEQSDDARAFQVLSDQKAFVVMASNVADKDAWVDAVDKAVGRQRVRARRLQLLHRELVPGERAADDVATRERSRNRVPMAKIAILSKTAPTAAVVVPAAIHRKAPQLSYGASAGIDVANGGAVGAFGVRSVLGRDHEALEGVWVASVRTQHVGACGSRREVGDSRTECLDLGWRRRRKHDRGCRCRTRRVSR